LNTDFVRAKRGHFYIDDKKIILRGYGFGTWLNLEHFMIGLPGTDTQIRQAIIDTYGKENAVRFWKIFYRSFIEEEDFKFLKSLGINAVRIPFNYHLFENDQNPYVYDESVFKEIDRVLQLCEQYEIYGILDLHAAPGGQNPDWHCDNATGESLLWEHADFRKRTISLWKYIATHYAENRWIAAYDLLNEPVLLIPDTTILNAFFKELIHEIRTVDPNHMLIVEGDMYSTLFEMFEPFQDSNIACTFHYYPMLFLHQYKEKSNPAEIEKHLFETVSIKDIRERLRCPIWCGETGATFYRGSRAFQESLLASMLDILEKHEISWSLWTYKDARSMGTLHPKENSDWMALSKRANREWNFWKDFNQMDQLVDRMIQKYPATVSENEKRKIGHRILADYQLIIKERYPELLTKISFEDFIRYPESFEFKNCEKWDGIINLVKKYTNP
jgi:endoglucanase